MVRVVFMGTPEFAVPSLQKLIQTQTVVGVVTQPDRPAGRGRKLRPSPVKVAAETAAVPLYLPKSLRSEESAAPLRIWQPDVIVVAAFGQILRPHVLNLPPYGCINVHASLLPRWRGASPIQHAIMAGDSETGITLMRMDEGLDTGPIYVQEPVPIRVNDTASTLHDRLAELGAELLGRHLDDIVAGNVAAVEQNDDLATYAPLIKKEAGQLDWQRSSVELDRHVRAMTPWPGAFTSWQGERLKILACQPTQKGLSAAQPGEVFSRNDTVLVQTGDGALQLDELQLAGKRAMRVSDFIRGRPDFLGTVLRN
jgi:methionyl-tRNA formyltransferase